MLNAAPKESRIISVSPKWVDPLTWIVSLYLNTDLARTAVGLFLSRSDLGPPIRLEPNISKTAGDAI